MGKREAKDLATGELWKQLKGTWQGLGATAKMSSTVCLTMPVFKNIRVVFIFSGLEGCSLLLSLPEVFFHIDCRLRTVGTKICKHQKKYTNSKKYTNTIFPLKNVEKCFLSHRCLKTWGFIQNTSKLENCRAEVGERKVSVRKYCYDTLWGLFASGIHLCEWPFEHIP